MTTLLERGMAMLSRSAPKVAGGIIIYQRDEQRVWINATWGRTEFSIETGDGGVRLETSDRDFIFAADELPLGGILANPQRGDRVTVVNEQHIDEEVYEVLAPGGAQVYRLCDPEGVMIRVHGKRLQ